ncbi:hypothetical protein [Nocardiopsis ganjiahuensis]|uniref:hypothetical protein n=1 Tax=Nocardiopsis ganjiahuensis TaxID=239984 RepID=UPI00036D6603|nr:hypothetical protein [Nocardiopsis ganjiahuensis]
MADLEVSGYIVGQGAAQSPPGSALSRTSVPEAVVTEDPVSGGPLVVPVGRAAR